MKKILVFDIFADYGHFKKPYTTTSPITYSFPSRTTIIGVIGAILGIEKNIVNEELSSENSNIALQILKPIKKIMIGHNLIDTKKAIKMARIKTRTQVKFEYVKDVKYRIYFQSDNEYYEKLKKLLENHQTVYSLSLGLSECLANYEYIGEYNISKKVGDTDIVSVVNTKFINFESVNFNTETEIFSDRFARDMKKDREVIEYSDIIFERNAKKIPLKNIEYYKVEDKGNIIFL